jgi:hypothetical protein
MTVTPKGEKKPTVSPTEALKPVVEIRTTPAPTAESRAKFMQLCARIAANHRAREAAHAAN